MPIAKILNEIDTSLTPTKKGFTPIGLLVAASAIGLVLFGVTRVGICVAHSRVGCDAEWESLRTDTKAAGLGLVGLAAQSPWTKAVHLALGGGSKTEPKPSSPRRQAPAKTEAPATTTRRRRESR